MPLQQQRDKSSDGHNQYRHGYKLHLDVADGQIPISAVLTAAHVHDSQVAIPLSTLTAQRVTALYEVMDSAYDAQEIDEHVRSQSRVPIIDPRNSGRLSKSVIVRNYPRQLSWAEEQRYRERTMLERVNGRLKDEFGGRTVRVRGGAKVMTHLMFGVLALTADQLLRLVCNSGYTSEAGGVGCNVFPNAKFGHGSELEHATLQILRAGARTRTEHDIFESTFASRSLLTRVW